MKKIIFLFLVYSAVFTCLLPKRSTVSAAFGYDLQPVSFYACYTSAITTPQGFTDGNYRVTIGVRNNGTVTSPTGEIILFVNDYVGYFGYATAYTFGLGSINPNSSINVYGTKRMVTWGFDYVSTNLNDDNPANDELHFIKDSGPCPTTPTPTPTPTPPPVCPLKLSSEAGSLKYTFNNEWKYYVSFTPSVAGKADKISVKVGNWGNAQRSVSCKVTNNSGQNVSIEKSSAAFTSSSGALWRDISFKDNPFNLQANTQYRLYCKGPDSWGSLYWIYNQKRNPESRTYKIYMCQ